MLKVNVLMSTYNGGKYIEEQIDSVLSQVGVEVNLLIRDDGSKDNTISIINQYIENNHNVKMYSGNNLGPALSFLDLCRNTEIADYYAFCDQDDIWDDSKLLVATSMLEKYDQSKPNMYFSNLRLVDANGNYYRDSNTGNINQNNRYVAYIQNIATGCTMVFNNTCRDYVVRENPTSIHMHDYWIYLICKMLGNIIYDPTAHISYRQHDNNVCGMNLKVNKNSIRRTMNRIGYYLNEGKNEDLLNALNNFYTCYGSELSTKDKEKLLEIIHYRDSITDRARLLFDNEIHHYSKKGDIRYRWRIIKGNLQM